MNESHKADFESYDDKVEKEFKNFITEKQFSVDELRKAYYEVCGISEAGENADSELVNKMQEMIEDRYPLNKFSRLIEKLDEFDNAPANFKSMVDNLNLTYNEKSALNSIVEKGRVGDLEFYSDGELIAEIKITKQESPETISIKLLKELTEIFNDVSSKGELSVQFTEQ